MKTKTKRRIPALRGKQSQASAIAMSAKNACLFSNRAEFWTGEMEKAARCLLYARRNRQSLLLPILSVLRLCRKVCVTVSLRRAQAHQKSSPAVQEEDERGPGGCLCAGVSAGARRHNAQRCTFRPRVFGPP